jgi:hypothetical protein
MRILLNHLIRDLSNDARPGQFLGFTYGLKVCAFNVVWDFVSSFSFWVVTSCVAQFLFGRFGLRRFQGQVKCHAVGFLNCCRFDIFNFQSPQ